MIRKSEVRFSDKIMLNDKVTTGDVNRRRSNSS
jgi:hypothetical protein